MQLKLRRSQKTTGMLSKTVMFCLDARVELSPEERSNVDKYKLGSQVIYNSAAAQAHLATAAAGAAGGSMLKGVVGLAMAKLSLIITVDSLAKGHHIECKDIDELLGAEEAIHNACEAISRYVSVAQTFDGREIVVDIEAPATT